MPFTVTRPQPNGKLYIRRESSDGTPFWTADKSRATPFSETDADALAAEINRLASTPCQVEGIRHDDEVAQCK